MTELYERSIERSALFVQSVSPSSAEGSSANELYASESSRSVSFSRSARANAIAESFCRWFQLRSRLTSFTLTGSMSAKASPPVTRSGSTVFFDSAWPMRLCARSSFVSELFVSIAPMSARHSSSSTSAFWRMSSRSGQS